MKFEITPYTAQLLRDKTSDYRREAERAAIYFRAHKSNGYIIYYTQDAPPHYAFAAQAAYHGGIEHLIMFTA